MSDTNETKQAPAVEAGARDQLWEAARQFHNLTQGDSTVIIRPPSAEKRDAIIAAGERLRAALARASEAAPEGATQAIVKAARALVDMRHAETTRDHEIIAGIDALEQALGTPCASEAAAGEPVAWVRFLHDGLYEGPIMNCDRRRMEEIVHPKQSEWTALVVPTKAIAPPAGCKLVPIEPTREMWVAVNKLDDEMAAGNYDGKGCSIEQAWNCLLDAAPQPASEQQAACDTEAYRKGVEDGRREAYQRISGKEFNDLQKWLLGNAPSLCPARPAGLAAWALAALKQQAARDRNIEACESVRNNSAAPEWSWAIDACIEAIELAAKGDGHADA